MDIENTVKGWLRKEEGLRTEPYLDTRKILTFGYGFTYITENEAEYMLEQRVRELQNNLNRYLSNNKIMLDDFRRAVLIDMSYQLGWNGCLSFKKMWESIKNKDYNEAANQMIDSNWHRQTRDRCSRLARKMRLGISSL